MEAELQGVRFEIRQGDITGMDTDAIVNAANTHFWMGGGVAGAIKRAGGAGIEAEAMKQGPAAIGESVVTGGGALPARYVIHAAVMGQDLQTSAGTIAAATRSSLERARDLGIASLAFPAFGTGVGGFPAAGSARAMIDAAVGFVEQEKRLALQRIVFVLFSEELREAFRAALASAQSGRR